MSPVEPSDVSRAQEAIGYRFRDPSLLSRALTHASIADSRLASNERLEFLGDAILGTIVCDYLFQRFPDLLEGDLTKIKSTVVSRRTCSALAIELGLEELLALGKGMKTRTALAGVTLGGGDRGGCGRDLPRRRDGCGAVVPDAAA